MPTPEQLRALRAGLARMRRARGSRTDAVVEQVLALPPAVREGIVELMHARMEGHPHRAALTDVVALANADPSAPAARVEAALAAHDAALAARYRVRLEHAAFADRVTNGAEAH